MNGQELVMGWIWGQIKEGASQGAFPGSGFDNGWTEAPFTEVRLQKGKMGWGYGGSCEPSKEPAGNSGAGEAGLEFRKEV